jgi:hypothetical protein
LKETELVKKVEFSDYVREKLTPILERYIEVEPKHYDENKLLKNISVRVGINSLMYYKIFSPEELRDEFLEQDEVLEL